MACCWRSQRGHNLEFQEDDGGDDDVHEHNREENYRASIPVADPREKRRQKIKRVLNRIVDGVFHGRQSPEGTVSVFGKVRILVVGRTGSGKTTLIRLLLGEDGPQESGSHGLPGRHDIEQEWRWTANNTLPLVFHDSNGMDVTSGRKNLEAIREFLSVRQKSSDISSKIHLIWYVIGANDNRIADDGDLMATVASGAAGAPILLIMTYNDVPQLVEQHVTPEVLHNLLRSLLPELRSDILRRMVRVGNSVCTDHLTGEISGDVDSRGLLEVSRSTMELLDKHLKYTWIASQMVDLEAMLDATVSLILESGKRALLLPMDPDLFRSSLVFHILHERVCKIWNAPDPLKEALWTISRQQQHGTPRDADSLVGLTRFLAALVTVGTARTSSTTKYGSWASADEQKIDDKVEGLISGTDPPEIRFKCKRAWRIFHFGLRLLLAVLYLRSAQVQQIWRWSKSSSVSEYEAQCRAFEKLQLSAKWKDRFLEMALTKLSMRQIFYHPKVFANLIGDFAVEQYGLFFGRQPSIPAIHHDEDYGLQLGYLDHKFILSNDDANATNSGLKRLKGASANDFQMALEDYPVPNDEYYIEYIKNIDDFQYTLIKKLLC